MGNQLQTPQSASNSVFNYHQKGQDWIVEGSGTEQTPINIVPNTATNANETMKMEFFLTDHTLSNIKVNDTGVALTAFGPFSKLRATDVDGEVYEFEALQFHFHAPAEHTINGGQYELELHIVHKMTEESEKRAKTQRNLAVVAVFFQLDKDPRTTPNAFINALKLDRCGCDIDLNMHELLSQDLCSMNSFFAYKGGLTTPPCSELVNWYLFETPLKITQAQLNHFNLRWKDNINFANGHGNNRPVQPLNHRTVLKSNNCCVMGKSEEFMREMMAEVKPKDELKLTLNREMVLEEFSVKSHHTRVDTQSFIDSPTFKKKASYVEHIGGEKSFPGETPSMKKSAYATPYSRTSSNKSPATTFSNTVESN
jgi:carbonic anhydrase